MGFTSRKGTCQDPAAAAAEYAEKNKGKKRGGGWNLPPHDGCRYGQAGGRNHNIVLTNAAVAHRRLFEEFHDNTPSTLRACEAPHGVVLSRVPRQR